MIYVFTLQIKRLRYYKVIFFICSSKNDHHIDTHTPKNLSELLARKKELGSQTKLHL